MCEVLKEIYQEVLEEDFSFELSKRIKLQKVVYLMEVMGVYVGDYSFSWNKYGPYSIALDSDAYRCSQNSEVKKVNFTDEAKNVFAKIRKILSQKVGYDDELWLESIASLHYLKYVSRVAYTDSDIINELMKRKARMDDVEGNKAALRIAKTLEAGK